MQMSYAFNSFHHVLLCHTAGCNLASKNSLTKILLPDNTPATLSVPETMLSNNVNRRINTRCAAASSIPHPSACHLHTSTRPRIILGTILGSLPDCALVFIKSLTFIDLQLISDDVLGIIALHLGNAFIVGIN